jgi:poly(3-hydroxybutyrate) depolymerase
MVLLALLALGAIAALAQDIVPGQIAEGVKCAANPSQTYALYVPSSYTRDHAWPLILAFDPRARGHIPVEIYKAAAERFGYIVAGSNNSQNGSWSVSIGSAEAMLNDVVQRFPIEPKQIYAAGMSGGSRVAFSIALGSNLIAGVIGSSAGYPDSKPRKAVPFAVFGTAGTEDFNYLEMHQLDRVLTSPHRLAVFEGGHVWLSSALASEAVEWMDLQAMKSGRKPRDPARIDQSFANRSAAVAGKSGKESLLALEAIVSDFEGLKDMSAFSEQAAVLRRDKRVREALKRDRADEENEQRQLDEIMSMERQLASGERQAVLNQLRARWKKLSAASQQSVDSSERRMARRISRGLAMGVNERSKDPEYRAIIAEFRQSRPQL